MIRTVIIILNYRVKELTCQCIESLYDHIEAQDESLILVVDNDSKDGSFEHIKRFLEKKNAPIQTTVLDTTYNGGFSFGNNFAIRYCQEQGIQPEYFWLLNPDAQIRPNALDSLINFMDNNSRVGISGNGLLDQNEKPWNICFRFPNFVSEFERGVRTGFISKLLSRWVVPVEMEQVDQKVDWLPGASFLIRSKVFEDIGLMDEDYFLYYEETDFCFNAVKSGWETWYVPSGKVMHISGASTGVVNRNTVGVPLPQYLFDSRRLYFLKNHGYLYTAVADLCWILGLALWRCRCFLTNRSTNDPKNLFKDSLKNSVLYISIRNFLKS